MAFTHLHVHTEYSLLDGASKFNDLFETACKDGQHAIAITDHGYMYGVAEFYRAALAFPGKMLAKAQKQAAADGRELTPEEIEAEKAKWYIKPLLGCEVYFTDDDTLSRDHKPTLYHMILIAKNNEGYENLMRIVSDAAVDGFYYKPRVCPSQLEKFGKGIVATTACVAGIVPRCIMDGRREDAVEWTKRLASYFEPGDFYIELQDQGITLENGYTQSRLNQELNAIAKELNLKTIGTNDIHYVHKEDAYTQDLMLCVGTAAKVHDENRMKFSCDEFYLKTEAEMRAALADYPECIDNTMEIAEKCNVTIEFGRMILPQLPIPEGETYETMLKSESLKGLRERYGDPLPQEVIDRFEHEYNIICTKGFAAYFLIVQEFVQWARDNGIGVGPGRGSAAGSIISYSLGITTFDPLENGLLFERFLSPERTEMPDIDMDFDDERRLDVIQHCRDLYGAEKIAHVITFSTMNAKQAVNDAARVLDYPVFAAQKVSKLIASAPGTTIDKTFKENPDFKKEYDSDPVSHEIIDAAMKLEGLTRGEGVHASAVLISPDAVSKYVPVKYDTKGGVIITQYSHTLVADLGLLKMDFLGLRTLTVISKALANIKDNFGIDIDPEKISFTDKSIFKLFAEGRTAGVFQVESAGMVALLKNMKPDRYSDIVAVLALFRPGPLNAGMVDDFVDRKRGKKEIVYYDDRLKSILEETYGTIVYQEQVMQISMVMCGFSAGKADKLRKAVAKKKADLMASMESDWINGAVENNYTREIAQKIWDDVVAFAEYAFNKSHSAAYGRLTLQTAWLKANYPNEYMAAVLSSYAGKTDKITHYIVACRKDHISIFTPDVNVSKGDFTATDKGIVFGLKGIRGVGENVADAIVAERERGGKFSSLQDFLNRIDGSFYNRKTIESLIKAGAFDSLGYTRRQLMKFVDEDKILESASKRQKDKASGQGSIFDMFEEDESEVMGEELPAPDGVEWETRVKLAYEKEMLGFYVSDHPLRPYAQALSAKSDFAIIQIEDKEAIPGKKAPAVGKRGKFAGLVSSFSRKLTKQNKAMAVFNLEDMEGSVECVAFPDTFEKYGSLLQDDKLISVVAKLESDDRGKKLIVYEIEAIEVNAEDVHNRLTVRIDSCALSPDFLANLNASLREYPGHDSVNLCIVEASGAKTTANLPLTVNATSADLIKAINTLVGVNGQALVV